MIRLSGWSLVLVVCMGLVTGVMIADHADTREEATLAFDHDTAQMYVGGEPVAEPMTTEDGTPITQLHREESAFAEHPANVIEWSPWRVHAALIRTLLSLFAASATASAQFMHASPIPVAWWVSAIETGVPLGGVGYGVYRVRGEIRAIRHGGSRV